MLRTRLVLLALPALLTLLASSAPAWALQTLDASDGATVPALISIQEPTRVRVDGLPITDVVGNLYSSHNCEGGSANATSPGSAGTGTNIGTLAPGALAPSSLAPTVINPAGEVALECDRDKGEIYLRPVTPGQGAWANTGAVAAPAVKPINLFVSTAQGTYTLVLQRVDRPADTIVIRDPAGAAAARSSRVADRHVPALAGSEVSSRSRLDAPLGPAPSHIRSLKAMLVMMATDRVPSDVRVEEVNQPIQLWTQSQFSLMRTYQGRGLIGERYQLTNISAEPLVLADQEFDRESGHVVAVSIENHNLLPGGSTVVYVIRLDQTDASSGGRP